MLLALLISKAKNGDMAKLAKFATCLETSSRAPRSMANILGAYDVIEYASFEHLTVYCNQLALLTIYRPVVHLHHPYQRLWTSLKT